MRVADYIRERFSSFGVSLTPADMLSIWRGGDVELTDEVWREVEVAMVRYVPELLLRPHVSEGGVSIQWDRDALLAYYRMRCRELGLKDMTAPARGRIRFV